MIKSPSTVMFVRYSLRSKDLENLKNELSRMGYHADVISHPELTSKGIRVERYLKVFGESIEVISLLPELLHTSNLSRKF